VPRFRLTLEYDGSDFRGWQVQSGGSGARTVQGTLEAAAADLFGRAVTVSGAGRTDAGVHAEGQVASLAVETDLGPEAVRRALNARLPEDLVVRGCEAVPDAFDPRRDARSKLYRYAIWNGRERSPLRRRRFHHVPGSLDVAAMAKAARAFEGTHDFASLQSAGSDVEGTVRTVTRCEIEASGPEIRLWVEGTGFLRHMVRALAGTLVEVGQGRRAPESVSALLAAGDRAAAGPTAPAAGLTLVAVRYPEAPGDDPGAEGDSAANPGP
jgi:tRNA pseudouridine38-40 synthase